MSQPLHRRPARPQTGNAPPARRLLSPQERFGAPEAETQNPAATPLENDPFMREIVPEELEVPAPKRGAGLQKNPPRHQKKKFERAHIPEVAKHEVKHFERHALPGHEPRKRAPSQRQIVRRKKVRRFAARMLVLGALFFAVQLGIAAFSAPQFQVQAVQLEGLSETPKTAAFPLAQKLVGQNIFRANRAAIQKALAALPTVKSARVERVLSFPPKMRVVLTERTPLAKVGAGQNWWVVDESGLPYRRAHPEEDARLYALTAPQFVPQEQKNLPKPDWQKAHAVLAALQSDNAQNKGENWKLRRVYLDKNGLASLRLSDQSHPELLVRLGEDDFARKLERARQSLDYLEKTGRIAGELNLISYEFPRWKPKSLPNGETPALARESESADNSSWG